MICLSLSLSSACTTAPKPEVLVVTKSVKARIPVAMLRPCEAAWRKAGGPATVQDFVSRGDHNEAALNACAAKVRKIAQWDAGQGQ